MTDQSKNTVRRPVPRQAPTGWSIRRADVTQLGLCHCGNPLAPCGGCGAARCPDCEPVQSDDCLWRL